MITRELFMQNCSTQSFNLGLSECRCYEPNNAETIIADDNTLPAPSRALIVEALTKGQEKTETTPNEEQERKVAEINPAELVAFEATKYYYYHPIYERVFVRNTTDIDSDILYAARVLDLKEEEEADAITLELPPDLTPEEHLELCHRENASFGTRLPVYRLLPIRIYVRPADTPQHQARPLPSYWEPDRREEWDKFCRRKRKEGRRILAMREENENARSIWAKKKAELADYYWEWRTDTKGERQWTFVRDEDEQERDEVYVQEVSGELKGPKLRAKDRATMNRGGIDWSEDGSEGFENSGGRRKRGRSSEMKKKWVHWRDKQDSEGGF